MSRKTLLAMTALAALALPLFGAMTTPAEAGHHGGYRFGGYRHAHFHHNHWRHNFYRHHYGYRFNHFGWNRFGWNNRFRWYCHTHPYRCLGSRPFPPLGGGPGPLASGGGAGPVMTAAMPNPGAAAPGAGGGCLTKTTLADGNTLFQDVCTNQAAITGASTPTAR